MNEPARQPKREQAASGGPAGERSRPGPGSVAWRINGERLVVCGWSRAILMQVAHPLIAAGVARHSGFRASATAPATRLVHTIRAMLDLTFGSDADARAIVARINAIHDRVHGVLGHGPSHGDGRDRGQARGNSAGDGGVRSDGQAAPAYAPHQPYTAHDPHLQAWVHLTLLDSALRTYQLLVGSLSQDEQDRYCDESRVIAEWLRVPSALLPATVSGMHRAIDARLASGEIVITEEARELANAILRPSIGRWLWPLGAFHRLITIGLLPPALRTAYGLSWSPGQARTLRRLGRVVRAAHRLAPSALTRWRAARRVTFSG
jgi:uncharacterized protein (DUF2236 family)